MFSTTTEISHSDNKSQKGCRPQGSSLQYKKDTIQIESPLLTVNKQMTEIDVCAACSACCNAIKLLRGFVCKQTQFDIKLKEIIEWELLNIYLY